MIFSRRDVLRLGLVGGAGLGLAYLRWRAGQFDLGSFLTWTLRSRWRELTADNAVVAVAACPSYQDDVLAALRRAWDDLGSPSLRGQRVVIKPNLVGYVPGPPANTHPRMLAATIALCWEAGAREVIVAEGTAFLREPAPILSASGLAGVLAASRGTFVDLNYDELRQVDLPGGYTSLETLDLPRTVLDADCLISLPKMKTHHWSGLSLSLKNLFGVVPGARYGWPKNALHLAGVPLAILDIYEAVRDRAGGQGPATLALVDGIEGMEGDGPLYGTSVPSGVIVASRDLVAADATCARLMGFDPAALDYLGAAEAVGLGWVRPQRITVRGADLASLSRRYSPAPGF